MTSPEPRLRGRPTREPGSLWDVRQIRAVFVINLAGFVGFFLTLGGLPAWAARHGHPESVVGAITGVMLTCTVLTQLVSPALMRRVSLRAVMVAGLVLMGAPAPFYLTSVELGNLFVLSALRGVGFALLTVVGAMAIPMASPPHRRGEAVGIYGLSAALPNMFAISAGAALTLAGRFDAVAWLAALPLLGLLLVQHLPGARPERPDAASEPLPSAVALRRLLLPSVVLFFITLSGGGLVTILPLQRPDGAIAAIALLVFGSTGALARWRIGRLTDRIGHRRVLPTLILLGTFSLASTAIGLTGRSTGGTVLLVVGAAVFGVSYGALQSMTLDLSLSRLPPANAPTASAIWNAAFDAGTAAGATGIGYLAGTALGGSWALGSGAVGLGAVLIAVLLRRRRR